MRPLKLTLRAFGPYADQQVLDFADLGGAPFFLINGPTGSGKSTVLDAMCFALYGETSGGERSGEDLRSQHVDRTVMPMVEFEFSIGDAHYRVMRSLEYERPYKKGKGMTTEGPQSCVYGAEGDDWKLLVSGKTDVTAWSIERLGFEEEQFRQVVMLPQGKFREFLSSSTVDKSAVLDKLFELDRVKRLVELLKGEKKRIETELRDGDLQRRGLLEPFGVEDPADLEPLRVEKKEALDVQREERRRQRTALDALEGELEQAKQLAKDFTEFAEARAELEKVEADIPAHQRRKTEQEEASKAALLSEHLERLDKRRELQEEAKRRALAADKAHARSEAETAEAKRTLEAREGEEKRREELRDRLRELEALAQRSLDLQAARKDLEEAKAVFKAAEQERQASKAAEDERQGFVKAAGEELHAMQQKTSQLKALELERDKLSKEQDEDDARLEREEQRGRLEGLVRKEEARAAELRERKENREEAWQRGQHAWVAGQAAILARDLAEGQACPVCGATAHPSPAQPPDGQEAPPSAGDLDELKALYEKAGRELDAQKARLEKARLDLAGLGEDEGGAKGVGEEQRQDRAERLKELGADIQSAREKEAGLAAQRQRLREAEEMAQEAVKRSAKAEEAWHLADKEADACTRKVQALVEQVPEDLRAPDAIVKERERVTRELEGLKEALARAKREYEAKREALGNARSELKSNEDLQKKAKQDLSEAREDLDRGLARSSFKDEAALRAAWRSPDELKGLEAVVRQHEDRRKLAEDHLARAKAKVEGREQPALEEMQKKVEGDRERLRALDDALAVMDAKLQELVDLIAELGKRARERAGLEVRYGLVGELSNVATDNRLNFERWVLAGMLDLALGHASQHLHAMSQGRYRLFRDEREKAHGGLDLLVDDAHTGRSRPVSTLSGGEGFMASLSLALGLSEAVQSFAGGIQLDTLFIDEGFGSLDPEALDQAVQSLMELNLSNRLVGIISHVEELKHRIPARLEVTKGERGSTARFVV